MVTPSFSPTPYPHSLPPTTTTRFSQGLGTLIESDGPFSITAFPRGVSETGAAGRGVGRGLVEGGRPHLEQGFRLAEQPAAQPPQGHRGLLGEHRQPSIEPAPCSMGSARRWHMRLVRSALSVRVATGLARCQSQPVPGPARVPACLAREPQPMVPGKLCQFHGHESH